MKKQQSTGCTFFPGGRTFCLFCRIFICQLNKANTITVSQTGTFFNNTPITLEALEQELLAKVKDDPDVPVLVRGDERLTYGAIMDVVKLVYKCKVKKMALVTVEK